MSFWRLVYSLDAGTGHAKSSRTKAAHAWNTLKVKGFQCMFGWQQLLADVSKHPCPESKIYHVPPFLLCSNVPEDVTFVSKYRSKLSNSFEKLLLPAHWTTNALLNFCLHPNQSNIMPLGLPSALIRIRLISSQPVIFPIFRLSNLALRWFSIWAAGLPTRSSHSFLPLGSLKTARAQERRKVTKHVGTYQPCCTSRTL